MPVVIIVAMAVAITTGLLAFAWMNRNISRRTRAGGDDGAYIPGDASGGGHQSHTPGHHSGYDGGGDSGDSGDSGGDGGDGGGGDGGGGGD